MINIIKQGTIKKTKTVYTIKCSCCGCEFECEGEDFLYMTKGLHGSAAISCPCCTTTLEFEYDSIPRRQEEIE